MMVDELISLVDVDGFKEKYSADIKADTFFGYPLKGIISAEKKLKSSKSRSIAYLSMEFGLASSIYNVFQSSRPVKYTNKLFENEVFSNYRLADYFFTLHLDEIMDLPIYSGGLGVLAGDTIKTMADMHISSVAVGILWNLGYFKQRFWFKYGQLPEKIHWDPDSYPGLIPLKNIINIKLKHQDIYLKLWKYYIFSSSKDFAAPLILLDSDIPQNKEDVRQLTAQLYRSDDISLRILQRIILGMGSIIALDSLGYNIDIYHLNEGHAAFSFIEKMRRENYKDIDKLKQHFVYTCHTPVAAGHDRFSIEDLEKFFDKKDMSIFKRHGSEKDGLINLTILALNLTLHKNAVSQKHGEVMRIQFDKYKNEIKSITNGVHLYTWMSESIFALLDKYKQHIGEYKKDISLLAKVANLKTKQNFRRDIWNAHQDNKQRLCSIFNRWGLKKDTFTICWSRRIAAYKRPSLILVDIHRLLNIAKEIGPIQIIFAGKAHPNDNLGFTHINEIMDKIDSLSKDYDFLKILMLENYDIYLAKLLTSSVDVWLNNPLPPLEASGTSGMKAIMNGIIQLTTLDGWVVEAKDADIGRIFGSCDSSGIICSENDLKLNEDSRLLYIALEDIVRLYYATNKDGKINFESRYIDMMINCLAASSRFNTYRMVKKYKLDMWGMS